MDGMSKHLYDGPFIDVPNMQCPLPQEVRGQLPNERVHRHLLPAWCCPSARVCSKVSLARNAPLRMMANMCACLVDHQFLVMQANGSVHAHRHVEGDGLSQVN